MAHKIRNTGVYNALVAQLDRAARHNRQGSFRTKERYYEAMKRFCAFLADEFCLQKLANLSGKHLAAYAIKLQAEGKAPSTIKTDLSAIRFFHDKLSEAKYTLPSNDELGVELERRRFGGVDKTWSHREFSRFVLLCMSADREDYAAVACLSYYAGLRVHECFRIDTATANDALRSGSITVKGKGGKIRAIPINDSIRVELHKLLDVTPRGRKLFVPAGTPTDKAIHDLQTFIHANRERFQDEDSTHPLTHHGLRHSYAANKYRELTSGGMTPLDASFEVSRLLGHERADVTRIYLASVHRGGESDG